MTDPIAYAPATRSWKLEQRLKREARTLRPSPGWKPMTGADIDRLLDAL